MTLECRQPQWADEKIKSRTCETWQKWNELAGSVSGKNIWLGLLRQTTKKCEINAITIPHWRTRSLFFYFISLAYPSDFSLWERICPEIQVKMLYFVLSLWAGEVFTPSVFIVGELGIHENLIFVVTSSRILCPNWEDPSWEVWYTQN